MLFFCCLPRKFFHRKRAISFPRGWADPTLTLLAPYLEVVVVGAVADPSLVLHDDLKQLLGPDADGKTVHVEHSGQDALNQAFSLVSCCHCMLLLLILKKNLPKFGASAS